MVTYTANRTGLHDEPKSSAILSTHMSQIIWRRTVFGFDFIFVPFRSLRWTQNPLLCNSLNSSHWGWRETVLK